MALASDATILFLEEPCAGLDKNSKKKLLKIIRDDARRK
jgi:ABC-type multidrug transport system ATPase subunit